MAKAKTETVAKAAAKNAAKSTDTGDAALKAEAAGKAIKDKTLVDITVNRGRTIQRDGITHIPGARLRVEPEEALRLIRIGAARDPNGRNAAPFGFGPDYGSVGDDAASG